MKILLVFYSRTGTTKKIAEAISSQIGCEVEEIIDQKKRSGPTGFFFGGRDAMMKKLTNINPIQKNPEEYDRVIVGTPVWVGTMSPAIRTYLTENKDKIKKLAVFTTQGGDRKQKIFDNIKELTGKEPDAEDYFTTKEVAKDQFDEKLTNFINKINLC